MTMTMTRNTTTTLFTLAVCLLLQVFSVDAAIPCHICGDAGNNAMKFPNIVLANVAGGKTCSDISLDVAINTPLGSSQCSAAQNQWKRCCNGLRPSGSERTTGLPADQQVPTFAKTGPNPICNICRDGDYPFVTSMVVNFLYVGEGSCAQYYMYGQQGKIQQHMCDPIKFFSYEPCGCGQFNPYFNPNHALNQQAQQAPSGNGNTNNGNSNTNNGNSNSNANNNKQPQQQRTPGNENADKDNLSLANSSGRGGSGGGGRRGLKGAAAPTEEITTTKALIEV